MHEKKNKPLSSYERLKRWREKHPELAKERARKDSQKYYQNGATTRYWEKKADAMQKQSTDQAQCPPTKEDK